ncbi:transferase family-domain-containing protein [Lipomyces doorenjongii]|uniref:transferase family-domain-containing protein n=1 Tax=Lipomyces doorenjongii TaxID=383834 RepID=UPI0034CD20C7
MTISGENPLTELRLRPTGWESSPESEQFQLSLMGHIMPKIYVLIAEVFSLPEDADTGTIVQSMAAGLEFALSQFPVLTGVLEMDADSGRMWVSKKRNSTVKLHIKHMAREDEFPSYEDLAKQDFPASMIVGNKLLPESVTAKQLHSPLGDNNEEGIPVAAFQLNFIRGGLIVGVAVHHALSDGPGCDGFLTTWAENSAAAASGTPFVTAKHQFKLQGSPFDVENPTPQQMEKLETAFPLVKDAGGPMTPPPADFKMPSLVCQMWHFPKSKAEALKLQASSKVEDGWVSTYDVVMALLWSSVSRAKIEMLKPDLDSKAILVHAVDTRKVWNPALPERFLGVGSCGARCEPMAIKDIIAPDNLSKVAATVRASINTLTPQYLTGLLQWIAGRDDKRWLEISINSFLGMDFGASSWQGMTAYEKHNFGFGWPKALRWPSPPFEGFVFLYPSRAAQKYPSEDEGIEVCVCLEKSCMDRLMKDETLLAYAHPRGL